MNIDLLILRLNQIKQRVHDAKDNYEKYNPVLTYQFFEIIIDRKIYPEFIRRSRYILDTIYSEETREWVQFTGHLDDIKNAMKVLSEATKFFGEQDYAPTRSYVDYITQGYEDEIKHLDPKEIEGFLDGIIHFLLPYLRNGIISKENKDEYSKIRRAINEIKKLIIEPLYTMYLDDFSSAWTYLYIPSNRDEIPLPNQWIDNVCDELIFYLTDLKVNPSKIKEIDLESICDPPSSEFNIISNEISYCNNPKTREIRYLMDDKWHRVKLSKMQTRVLQTLHKKSQEKGSDKYIKNVDLAHQLNVQSPYTIRILNELKELLPDTQPKLLSQYAEKAWGLNDYYIVTN